MKRSPLLASVLLLAAAGCKSREPQPTVAPATTRDAGAPAVTRVLRVARATGPIKPDGELNEPAWNAIAARTGAFIDGAGGEARPYSEARFLYDADNLYIALYASDNDIRAQVTEHDGPVWIDDSFALHLTPDLPGPSVPTYAFDISASGVVTDVKRVPGVKDDIAWDSGMKVGVDKDGSINDAGDEDEEWVVEAVLPLRSMGLEGKPGTRLFVDIGRCDTPRRTHDKRCGNWGDPAQRRVIEFAP